MALTQVEVISSAIALLGDGIITSLQSPVAIVAAAQQAWKVLLPYTLSTGNWRFATRIRALDNLGMTPLGGYWKYTYALPPDYLKLINVFPQTWGWEIYTNSQIFSNYNNVSTPWFIEYIFLPETQFFPEYFWQYFKYELAAELAVVSARDASLADLMQTKSVNFKNVALAADSQNRPQNSLASCPMLAVRSVSTFSGG